QRRFRRRRDRVFRSTGSCDKTQDRGRIIFPASDHSRRSRCNFGNKICGQVGPDVQKTCDMMKTAPPNRAIVGIANIAVMINGNEIRVWLGVDGQNWVVKDREEVM